MIRRKTSKLPLALSMARQSTSLKSVIFSLCDLGKLQDALKVVFLNPIQPDYSLYSKVLQLCVDKKAEKQGRLIHSYLIANAFPSNVYLNTKLIIFYSKVGDMIDARKVFDDMPERSMVSWTALISGYSQNGNSAEALMVFSAMHRAGVGANQFTYGSALRACTSLMCLGVGKQIQGCIQKGWFFDNLFVQSALVDFHAKCGEMDGACSIFEMMLQKDVVSWNTMIGGYSVQGYRYEALCMFCLMLREGVTPDSFSLGSILKASAGGNGLMTVAQVHGFITKLGFGSHNILMGSLIDAYVKCGSMKNADNLYKNSLQKDLISCTALITGYARQGKCSTNVLSLFNEVHQMCLGIDNVMLCSMINICANTASLELGRQIHAMTLKYQCHHDVAIDNTLIDMYSKSGEIEDASRVFDDMKEKNVISWTSLIDGYGKHGYGQQAIKLYQKMEHEGLKPNDVTFLSLLFACSHNGLTTEGWQCFNSMVSKYCIIPRAEHYSCIVDLFARGGQLEDAYNLICSLNFKPSPSLWGSILGACLIYGNMSLGEVAGRSLLHIDPDNPVNYVILGSIYAAAGLWDSALKVRQSIEGRSLRKGAGCSLLQLPNKRVVLLETS